MTYRSVIRQRAKAQEVTPKAFANPSPGLERQRQPWDRINKGDSTLKGFVLRGTLSGFDCYFDFVPRVVAGAPNLG